MLVWLHAGRAFAPPAGVVRLFRMSKIYLIGMEWQCHRHCGIDILRFICAFCDTNTQTFRSSTLNDYNVTILRDNCSTSVWHKTNPQIECKSIAPEKRQKKNTRNSTHIVDRCEHIQSEKHEIESFSNASGSHLIVGGLLWIQNSFVVPKLMHAFFKRFQTVS